MPDLVTKLMQFIRSLWGTFWILAATVLVTAALLTVLMRTVLPGTGLFHDDLESWIEAEIGVPLSIEDISLSLDGRMLDISVHHVILFDPESGKPQISFKSGGIRVDLLSSFGFGEVVTSVLSIERPKLSVVHHEDGSLTVDGFGGDGDGEVENLSSSSIGWLLSQPSVVVEDAEILITEKRFVNMQWHLSDVDLALVSSGYRHQATGSVIFGEQPSSPVKLDLEWFGDLFTPQGWDGQMHLQGDSIELAGLIGSKETPWLSLVQGSSDIEWWGEWLSGQLEKGRATFDRDDAFIESPGLAGGEFFWKKQQDQEWRLQMDSLVWGGEEDSKRKNHPASALIERKIDESGNDVLMGAIDRVHLVSSPTLSGLYATFTSGEYGVLASGDLQQIKFRSYPDSAGLMSGIEAQMDLAQISIHGLKSVDGYSVSGINGQLQVNGQEGIFSPAPGSVLLELDGIYTDPVKLDLHQSKIAWQQLKEGVLLSSKSLQASFGALRANGRAEILMPAGGGSPILDLQARVKADRVSDLMAQLPEQKMSPRLVRWLKNGLLSGELKEGTFLLKGALDSFPYAQGGGQFRTELQIHDLDLNYTDGWPIVTNGKALLSFDSESLQVKIDGGKIDGLPLNRLTLETKKLGKSPLKIYGQIVSDSKKLIHALGSTPLKRKSKRITSIASLEGDAILNLKIEVPIGVNVPVQANGFVELHNNRLVAEGMNISVNELHGNIEFDNDGVSIEHAKGEFLESPLLITAFSSGDDRQSELVINVEGELQKRSVEQWLNEGWEINISPFVGDEGDSPTSMVHWGGRIKIGIYENSSGIDDKTVGIDLHSDLKNIALSLPTPLAKSLNESWPTTLSLKFDNGDLQNLDLLSPDHAKVQFEYIKESDEWSGVVLLGDLESGDVIGDGERGLYVQGRVNQLNLGEWIKLQKEIMGGERDEFDHSRFNLQRVAIDAVEADLFGLRLDNLAMMANPHQDGYWGVGLSSDQLQGKAKVPVSEEDPMIVIMDRIWLGTEGGVEDKERDGEYLNVDTDLDLSLVPVMSVVSQDTRINGIDLGELNLQTRSTDNGIFFDDVTLDSEVMKVSAQGGWLQRSGSSLSRFNIHITGDQLGEMLTLFGYQGDIDKGQTSVQIKAEWPGNPADLSLGKMDGNLDISVGKGHLRDVDNSVGRVFGLLGIHTLTRRLSLDFSDITDKGMPFDIIEGSFELKNGHAHTRPEMKIDGPTSTIRIAGRTGIVAQDYDQIVSVSPKVSETLPATGALVGGPAGAAVGGVVLLYQKLFKKEGLITTRYTLTGSWDDPKLEPIKKKKAIPPVSEPFFP